VVRDEHLPALAGDLTLYAARVVRLLRRELPQPVGMRVLSILDESGALGVTQLASIDQCSQPTMSGTVNGLVERGWVTKEPHPEDARSSRVALTSAGRRTLAEARAANGEFVANRLAAASFGVDSLSTAVEVLRAVLDNPGTDNLRAAGPRAAGPRTDKEDT
jgi:DNA-binding MarR family transcriptional regulator